MPNQVLQLTHGHSAGSRAVELIFVFAVLSHRFLNDACDFLSCLGKYFVHILSHGVHLTEVLRCGLRCLRVRIKTGLVLFKELKGKGSYLFEEFLLHCNVVVRDAEYN
jgi:hypothetical protein